MYTKSITTERLSLLQDDLTILMDYRDRCAKRASKDESWVEVVAECNSLIQTLKSKLLKEITGG